MKKKQTKKPITNLRALPYFLCIAITICCTYSYAQIELVPVQRNYISKPTTSARTKVDAKKLPFWDDFSFPSKEGLAQDSLWQDRTSVWLNNGMGINAPSLGVVTFDGLDATGKPYNVNDVLAKGFADNLTSQALRMDLIDPSLRSTVVMTFYYQFQGNGESPDPGDSLFLQFKNKDEQWETVWSRNNDGTLDKNVFQEIVISITNSRFFHDKFQFRFRNYARLSGPYDTWNLDYVFIGNGQVSNDPPRFPDRTIAQPLTSLFKDYRAIPIKHFKSNPAGLLIKPSITVSNQRSDQVAGAGQPVNYVSQAIISTEKNDVITKETIDLDNSDPATALELIYKTFSQMTLKTLPAIDKFDTDADSISIKIKATITSGDNVVKVLLPEPKGDYEPFVYSPIDFRVNDSTSSIYTLSKYYAYDDGTAEYGASLKGFGAQIMYKFDMQTTEPDTLVGVYLYFPRFGDETSQVLQFKVLKNLDGSSSSELYSESITLQRSQQDQFTYHKFGRFVGVIGTFFVGWQQNTSASIVIGLDKNTDSNTKMYFNTNGGWEQPTTIKGSLMIRPAFGKGGVVVGLPENEKQTLAYPNPNQGTFFLTSLAENIQLVDLTGREVAFQKAHVSDTYQITLNNTLAGVYILRYTQNEKIVTQKITVLP